jgi:hypothetical protein
MKATWSFRCDSDGPLGSRVGEFAAELSDLLRQTIGAETPFDVVRSRNGRPRVGPSPVDPSAVDFGLVPLPRTCDGQTPRLFLRVSYLCEADRDPRYFRIAASTFGLWVRPDATRGARPVVRVEYVRDPRSPDHPAAHVHLHAECGELGWIYGTARRDMPRLAEIHFPVGGRRFRPSIEDFLLFLQREQLFTEWAGPSWRDALRQSQQGWEQKQARAAAREFQDDVAAVLRDEGWRVERLAPAD